MKINSILADAELLTSYRVLFIREQYSFKNNWMDVWINISKLKNFTY